MKRIVLILITLLAIMSTAKSQNIGDYILARDSVGSVGTPTVPDDSPLLLVNTGVGTNTSRRISIFRLKQLIGSTALTFGAANRVPYMNPGGTDFIYLAGFEFDGSTFSAPDISTPTVSSGALTLTGTSTDLTLNGNTNLILQQNSVTRGTFSSTGLTLGTKVFDYGGNVNLTSINSLTYPSVDGTSGQVMTTDGLGVITFQDPSGLGAGSGLTENAGNIDLGGTLTADATITGTVSNQWKLNQEAFAGEFARIFWDDGGDEVFFIGYEGTGSDLQSGIHFAGRGTTWTSDYNTPGTAHSITLGESGSNMDFQMETGSSDAFDFIDGDIHVDGNLRISQAGTGTFPALTNAGNIDFTTTASNGDITMDFNGSGTTAGGLRLNGGTLEQALIITENGTTGAVPDNDADNIVIDVSGDSGGISVLTDATNSGNFIVGDLTDPDEGTFRFVNGSDIWETRINNSTELTVATGQVDLGNFAFDSDQTVGAGQDDFVLTYDNGSGLISLEAGGGGGSQDLQSVLDQGSSADVATDIIIGGTENSELSIQSGEINIENTNTTFAITSLTGGDFLWTSLDLDFKSFPTVDGVDILAKGSNDLNIGAATGDVTINTNLIPTADNTHDLGALGTDFQDIFVRTLTSDNDINMTNTGNVGNGMDIGFTNASATGNIDLRTQNDIRIRVHDTGNIDFITDGTGVGTPTTSFETDGDIDMQGANLIDVGNVLSGTYTPTITDDLNVTSSTAAESHYMRVFDHVHVFGTVTIDLTSAATLTRFDISFPIASAINLTTDVSGNIESADGEHGPIITDISNDRAQVEFTSDGSGTAIYKFNFSYIIK